MCTDYTAQKYFENHRGSLFPQAQFNITATCLTYLSFDQFGRGYCLNDEELEFRLEESPFLLYAASYWGYHARGQVEETGKEMVLTFLEKMPNVACASQVLLTGRERWRSFGYSQRFPKDFSAMHLLALFGLDTIMCYWLENGARADTADGWHRTPLSYAAENGCEAVVKVLAAQDGIDLNSQDLHGQRSPLSFAAGVGHEAVVGLLAARHDVDVNSKDKDSQTPLSLAVANGHEAVVRLLVARIDTNVHLTDSAGRTALLCAAKNGHNAVLQLLLARGDIDVNLKDWYGRPALSYGVENGHEKGVRLLLAQENIEIHLADPEGWTPLSYAVENGHKAIVHILLARYGIQVSKYTWTALSVD
jgi:ankyrin repeat protein